MAPADLDAPAPWTAVGDGQVWRLPFTALGRVDVDEAGDASALFPGLVSIGTDRTGRVLVNLEAAHGLISVTGPPAMTTEVLSAMAMELATSRWSDQMRITLAGFGDDLIPLAPDRITAVPTRGRGAARPGSARRRRWPRPWPRRGWAPRWPGARWASIRTPGRRTT